MQFKKKYFFSTDLLIFLDKILPEWVWAGALPVYRDRGVANDPL